ncbi:MAG TPA: hypothetical protein VFG45_08895 [Candidatus Nitrosocosmicus sp.]|nr:hypothetical protein [Candidatus Nitrosocosmicus sp.]
MNPVKVENKIKEIVNRETEAWNQKDVEKLLSIFHPDMVWPWPRTPKLHDPIDWIFELGRFDYQRWQNSYTELFDSHELIHNNRTIQKNRNFKRRRRSICSSGYRYTLEERQNEQRFSLEGQSM